MTLTFRFCNDFRRLNEVSEFDAYPMPRVDELIERLGPARYLTTLDLTKGYWQVPLTRTAREETAFGRPVPVHCPSLRRPWSPGNVPEDDGPAPTASPGLCSRLYR